MSKRKEQTFHRTEIPNVQQMYEKMSNLIIREMQLKKLYDWQT